MEKAAIFNRACLCRISFNRGRADGHRRDEPAFWPAAAAPLDIAAGVGAITATEGNFLNVRSGVVQEYRAYRTRENPAMVQLIG